MIIISKYWNRIGLREKIISFALIVLIVLFIIYVSVTQNKGSYTTQPVVKPETKGEVNFGDICESRKCNETSERILSWMNLSVDPCADFYEYACGGWKEKNPIPPGKKLWEMANFMKKEIDQNIRDILELKGDTTKLPEIIKYGASTYYNSCLYDTEKDGDFGYYVNSLLQDLIYGGKNKLGKVIGILERELVTNFFITFKYQEGNQTISLKEKAYHLSDDYLIEPIDKPNSVKSKISRLWPLVYPNTNLSSSPYDIVNFERKISIFSKKTDDIKIDDKETIYDFDELKEILPNHIFNWDDYFEEIFLESHPNLNTTELKFKIDYFYFKNLGKMIEQFEDIIIIDYLKWKIFSDIGDLSFQIHAKRLKFDENYEKKDEPKLEICTELTTKLFYGAMVHSYGKIYLPLKDITQNIESRIIKSFRKIYRNDIKFKIGYQKLIADTDIINKHYEKLVLPNSTSQFDHRIAIRKFLKYSKIIHLDLERDWVDYFIVNAFNRRESSTIDIPMGYLGIPQYGFPLQVLNFGGIGYTIGHELAHSYTFLHTECLMEQYSHYREDKYNITTNKEMTLGEDLADNYGIRLAFDAYKTYVKQYGVEQLLPGYLANFSHEKLFFLSAAQSACANYGQLDDIETRIHSLENIRIRGVLENYPRFFKAYNCPEPRHTCSRVGKLIDPNEFEEIY